MIFLWNPYWSWRGLLFAVAALIVGAGGTALLAGPVAGAVVGGILLVVFGVLSARAQLEDAEGPDALKKRE